MRVVDVSDGYADGATMLAINDWKSIDGSS